MNPLIHQTGRIGEPVKSKRIRRISWCGYAELSHRRGVWVSMAQTGRAFGTAAEFVVVPSMQAVRLADNVSLAIGASLGVDRPNDNQLIISLLFLGFALGQLFYGPVSDSVGRKPAVYAGLGVRLLRSGLHPSLATVLVAGALAASAGHFHVRPHLFTSATGLQM